ncbi:MAG: beta-ketoacyl-ACP synthase 3, partial [Bdellovibrionota bacterium]
MSRKTKYSKITGTGSAHPLRRVTNEELVRDFQSSAAASVIDAEWIRTRTGISERRLSVAGEDRDTNSSLAATAAVRALELANKSASDVDQLIVATCTPDRLIPSTACLVQEKIGATKAWAFDVNAACSGFVYALTLADQAIRSGSARTVLVIGSDVLSAFTDWRDPSSAVLFGDGAGAVVLEATIGDGTQGILTTQMGSGGGHDLFHIEAGGSACSVTPERSAQGLDKMRMRGREIFKASVRTMTDYAHLAAETCAIEVEEIDWLIPHQANLRIL